MRKKIRQSLTALMALVLVTAFTSPTSADSSELPSQTEESLQYIEAYEDASEGLDYAAAKSDPDIDIEFLQEFAAGYEVGGGNLINISDQEQKTLTTQTELQAEDITPLANCNGTNGYMPSMLFLDSCNASAISSLIATGAGLAAIAAAISAATGVGAVAAGAIAGALAAAGGLATLCNAWNTGIIIHHFPVTCSPQF